MKSILSIRAGYATLALGMTSVALSPALAQTPGNTEAATMLDTIIVTANKRVENVQEVPKQIVVVTSEALSKSGVTTMAELGNIIPSIGGAIDPRTSTPPLRGISSFGTTVGVQSQTGIIIDDVPQASYSSLFKELADIQSIEVLAGPQSTLSGRNAAAGLINIHTREPSEHFSAEAFLEQTSDHQQRFTTFISGPLRDTLAFSVSAFSNEWEGHLRSQVEMKGNRHLHLGGWDTQGVRGKLRWRPNNRLSAVLTAYTMENTSLVPAVTSSYAYWLVEPSATHRLDASNPKRIFSEIYPGLPVEKYNVWIGANGHSTHSTRDRGSALKLDYELGNGTTLTSISSLTKASMPRQEYYFSFDGMNVSNPAYPYNKVDYATTTKTQELRLASPGGQTLDYIIGTMYTDTDTVFPFQVFGISPVNWIRAFDMQSAALFTRGTLRIGKRDSLTAGLRYQDDKMHYSWAFLPLSEDAVIPDYIGSGGSAYNFSSAEISWRHELTNDVSTYFSAARAESGKVYDMGNLAGAQNEGLQPLDSQKVLNFEIGLKSQWLDRRLTINANLFHANYDNYQIRTREAITDTNIIPTFRLFTIGKVETRGIELDARFRVSERLDFKLGGAWVDATIKDFPNAQCYIRQTPAEGCNGLQDNLAGNRMPQAPKFKITGAASYFIPLNHLPFDMELTGSYRWQSKTWFDFRGNPNLYQNGYGVLNLSLSLRERDDKYQLSIFINNVLDKQFYINMDDDAQWSGPAYYGSFARDSFRYAGMNLRVNF